jgi:hypothetical protein
MKTPSFGSYHRQTFEVEIVVQLVGSQIALPRSSLTESRRDDGQIKGWACREDQRLVAGQALTSGGCYATAEDWISP